jgi:hypothetical protein
MVGIQGGQHLPQLLHRFEEIVRAVDLVDVAGFRMADDESRAVDPPRLPALTAHDAFGVVLGLEVGMAQFLGFLEHVLAKNAVVEPCGGDRAHLVKAAGLHDLDKLDRVACALAVGDSLRFRGRGEVVKGGKVEQMLDRALEFLVLRRQGRAAVLPGRLRSQ